MRLVTPDKVANLIYRKWNKTRITPEAKLISSPLDEGLDILPSPRADPDLSLCHSQVRIRLEMII